MNPIQTHKQVIEWVEAHLPSQDGELKSPKEKAMWFYAYRMAEEMHNSMNLKDTAEMLLKGMRPLSVSDAKNWLLNALIDDPKFDLRSELHSFWGVPS